LKQVISVIAAKVYNAAFIFLLILSV